ncbi:MAG: hypothetical protein RLZZ577_67 [Bacteroidota bacterium]|jgi:predicted CopG family antitoxin
MITTKINKETKKKLLVLKALNNEKSISDVIDYLIELFEEKKEETKFAKN